MAFPLLLPRQTDQEKAEQARIAVQQDLNEDPVAHQSQPQSQSVNFGDYSFPNDLPPAFQQSSGRRVQDEMLSPHEMSAYSNGNNMNMNMNVNMNDGLMTSPSSWGAFPQQNNQMQFAMPEQSYGLGSPVPQGNNNNMVLSSPMSPMSGHPSVVQQMAGMDMQATAMQGQPMFAGLPHPPNFRPAPQQQQQQIQQLQQLQQQQQQQSNTYSPLEQPFSPASDDAGSASTPSAGRGSIPNGQQPLPASQPLAPCGPMSSAVEIPPRPKPGRKPLPQEDAVDRRRIQNRMAQRNFRDKRAQKVAELTVDLDKVRKQSEDAGKASANMIHDEKERSKNLAIRNEILTNENDILKRELKEALLRAEAAEREVHSLHVASQLNNNGFPNATPSNVALPPMAKDWRNNATAHAAASHMPPPTPVEDHTPHEIDFTSMFKSKTNGLANTGHDQDNWMNSNPDVEMGDDTCGFCTDRSNCACHPIKKPEPALAPGGCDACVADPERAARCKELAAQSKPSQRPNPLDVPSTMAGLRNDSMAQTGYMSCSKFVDHMGQRIPPLSQLFPGSFHSYPAVVPGTGFDVNEQEVAQVLQNMSRRNTVTGAPPA